MRTTAKNWKSFAWNFSSTQNQNYILAEKDDVEKQKENSPGLDKWWKNNDIYLQFAIWIAEKLAYRQEVDIEEADLPLRNIPFAE